MLKEYNIHVQKYKQGRLIDTMNIYTSLIVTSPVSKLIHTNYIIGNGICALYMRFSFRYIQ